MRSILIIVPAAFLLCAAAARAQTTGGIAGQILDSATQAPVKDAVVIAQSPALQGEQTAVTDEQGSFEITLLPTGLYTLTVQREGYQPFSQAGLKVNLDRTIRVAMQIVPESFKGEQVEIVAQRPNISVNSVQQGGTVSKEQMALVPYGRNSRNFEAVATSIPGVHGDLFGVQMAGSGSPESNYIIDGVMVNNPAYGHQGTTLLQDFVEEVDIKTGGYQAEYGRSSGGIVNVVTKSGGNEFHGSVFLNWSPYEATRKQVGATFAVAIQRSQHYNLDFGTEVGGPILKDKLWFFAGFAPQLVSTNTDRIIQAQLDAGNGSAQHNADGSLAFKELARQTYVTTQTSYQFTGKLTYLINENHNLALAIYGNPTTTSGGAALNGNEGSTVHDETTGSIDSSLRYSGKLLNKSMLLEAGLTFHRENGAQGYTPNITLNPIGSISSAQRLDTPAVTWQDVRNLTDPVFDDGTIPASQKSQSVLTGCAPTASGFNPCPVQGYGTGGFGFVSSSDLERYGGALKLSNFVELFGHHHFKYGVDGNIDRFNQQKQYTGGQYFVANLIPGVFLGVRGYGHGTPGQPRQPQLDGSGKPYAFQDAVLDHAVKNYSGAAFVQDTWSIFDKVVLDAGLRYEVQRVTPDTAHAVDGAGQPYAAPTMALNNLMPRIGLIYDFTSRGLSKVYASYGRFYEYVPLDLADRSLTGEPSASYATSTSSCKNVHDPRTCALLPVYSASGYGFVGNSEATDPNLKGQYTDEYQGGVQYQIYRDISIGVDYTHKQLGRVIEDMSIDDGVTYFISNPGEPGALGEKALTANGVVPFPKPVRKYDGITLSINKNFSDSYFLKASYTYSAYRGNYPGLFKSDTGQLDPNITSEYDLISLLPNRSGPLPGDVPNSFKADGGYVFQISPGMQLQTGAALRANQGGPTNYLGAHPTYGPGEGYILPRGIGPRLPWTWQLDLRGALQYTLAQPYVVALSLDIFNLTNNQAVAAIDENYTFDSVHPIVNGKVTDLAYLRNTAGQPVTVNSNFQAPTAYQLPLSARIGAKLAF